jgi:FlaA1/EpsC-like NDP-sugar epimerase
LLGEPDGLGESIVESIIERRSNGDRGIDVPARPAVGLADVVGIEGTSSARRRPTPPWIHRHVQLLVLLDALAAGSATWLAKLHTFGTAQAELHVRSFEIPYAALMIATVPTWLAVLATSRCYDVGPLGTGNSEARRVISAGAHFLAVIAVAYYLAHLEDLGRGFLIAMVPLATVLTLAGRAAARYQLHLQRSGGHAQRRAVIAGSLDKVQQLVDHLAAHPGGGVRPVAALVAHRNGDTATPLRFGGAQLPVVGSPDAALDALARTDADLLIVTGASAPGSLRQLTWQLEGSGIDVMVAPTAAHLAGPQLDMRPVAGLPLFYVDHTTLESPRLRSLSELQVRRVGLTRTSAWRNGTRSRR